ncbi:hypothetical protein BH10ACI1_BH10ACI1_33410 [soil metagenome]
MIRMGRNKEQTNEINTTPNQEMAVNSEYQFMNAPQPPSTRGISESESMARDIKEGRLSGFVGNGTVLTGETEFQAMLRIDGHLKGQITSDNGTLIIGSTGRVDANISVAKAIVNGIVNGDIIASEKIEFGPTAQVTGNIQTPRLIIEDGAMLEGKCSMTKERETVENRLAEANLPHIVEPQIIHEVDESDDEEIAEAVAN